MVGANEPLPLHSVEYNDESNTASCKILYHRAMEREKIIREHQHLFGQNYTDAELRVMELNHLLINQMFFQPEIWNDEKVYVSATFEVNPELAKIFMEESLDDQFFDIKGPGIQWRARAFNFPKGMQWSFDPSLNHLVAEYQIYKGSLCFEDENLQLFWGSED